MKTKTSPSSPTVPPVQPQSCRAKTKTGKPCRTPARPDGRFCFAHDPTLAGARAAGNRRGAATANAPRRRATLPPDSPLPPLESSRDVVVFLGGAIHRVMRGELDAKIGNAVGYMAGVLLRALVQCETVERIARLEAAVAALPVPAPAAVGDELATLRREAVGAGDAS